MFCTTTKCHICSTADIKNRSYIPNLHNRKKKHAKIVWIPYTYTFTYITINCTLVLVFIYYFYGMCEKNLKNHT